MIYGGHMKSSKIDDLSPITFYNPRDYLKRLEKYQFSVRRLGILSPLHWKDDLGIPYDKKYSK